MSSKNHPKREAWTVTGEMQQHSSETSGYIGHAVLVWMWLDVTSHIQAADEWNMNEAADVN